MTISLALNIDAVQQDIALSGPLEADPGDLFRLGDECVVFGGHQIGLDRALVILRRGCVGTTRASHTAGTSLIGVVDAKVSGSDETPPSPFAGGGGGTGTLADVLQQGAGTGPWDILVESMAGTRAWASDTTPQTSIVWGANGSLTLYVSGYSIGLAANGTLSLINDNGSIVLAPDGSIALTAPGGFALTIAVDGTAAYNGPVILSGLPTSDPAVAGALYNNLGVVMVSAG